MKLFKYQILEWLWTIKYFIVSSPIVKRWRLARLLAHNEAVFQYRVGLPTSESLPSPGSVVTAGRPEMKAAEALQEQQIKEVVEEYE